MTHHHPEKKLVLFDIDGTLLRAGRTHWKVFKKAFKEIVDIDIKDDHWGSYQGFYNTEDNGCNDPRIREGRPIRGHTY